MRRGLWGVAWVACLAGVVAVVHGQNGERYEVEPTAQGRKMGVHVYRVAREQPPYSVGSDYDIEIVGASQRVIGVLRYKERPSGVTTLAYADVKTGRRLEAKYGPGLRWVELRDPATGVQGRSEFVENGSGKPSFRKNASFRTIEGERKPDWEQMFEAASAVSTFDARRKERYEKEHGPTVPMKPQARSAAGPVVVAASAQNYCGGMADCRGVSYSLSKSACCAAAKQSASSCCGMNQYCIGCCAFSGCDSYCTVGDYLCPVCGVSGNKCSAPVSNCYGNVSCPPGYMCSGTGCIPMF